VEYFHPLKGSQVSILKGTHAYAGMRAELVLGALERKLGQRGVASQHRYLQQRLQYDADERLMDSEDRAVMMAWEG
jgi:hypothetical protein